MLTAGIDIGGTFTDIAVFDDCSGRLYHGKTLTTPDAPERAALSGLLQTLDEYGLQCAELASVIHGTTLVSNVLIERKGATTALITTQGFRDILEFGRERRYHIYDLDLQLPRPLVARRFRYEVPERVDAYGNVVTPLDAGAVHEAVARAKRVGAESIAVCFLHSYRNPQHEHLARSIIEQFAPEMYISLSVEVAPEIREYERLTTTVINAYAQPTIADYLAKLRSGLRDAGASGDLRVVLSSGGITTADSARRFPVRIVESGPAGGAMYASAYLDATGVRAGAISFDMGGTTAKLCLVRDGRADVTNDFEVDRIHRFRKGSGLPIRLPAVDLIEIGAGGGSIAAADRLGTLSVGPLSAGADPGPACYGRGGIEPTVTDANLILGYLDERSFLGGRLYLDRGAAEIAVKERVADKLGIDLVRAAWGIHEIASENMASAASLHATEKGEDPSGYAILTLGGAGPVHAYRLAQHLGAKEIISPVGAGIASAIGFLTMRPGVDLVRTYMSRLDELDVNLVNQLFEEMYQEGLDQLAPLNRDPGQIELERSCDARFVGQGSEVAVPLTMTEKSKEYADIVRSAFFKKYAQVYHVVNETWPVEALNWRLSLRGPRPPFKQVAFTSHVTEAPTGTARPERHRPVYFPDINGFTNCPVYRRDALPAGTVLSGPAVIEESESTLVVGPGGTARVDIATNITVTVASLNDSAIRQTIRTDPREGTSAHVV